MFAGWSHTFALTFQAARSGSLIFDQLPGIQAAKTPQTAYPNEKYGNWTSKKKLNGGTTNSSSSENHETVAGTFSGPYFGLITLLRLDHTESGMLGWWKSREPQLSLAP